MGALKRTTPPATMSPGKLAAQIAMYKEDQLLAHPGGALYFLKGGEINAGHWVGFLAALKNFFEDLISGFNFGAYMPAGEKSPEGPGASL